MVTGNVLEYVHEPRGPDGVYMGVGSIVTFEFGSDKSWSDVKCPYLSVRVV